ncbi:hypothetical protein M3Y94_00634100 [Aphelenchoides besseyi]|nr:hypothetical protein M3Y94_00634100 [Aphelenchoides besseyi]
MSTDRMSNNTLRRHTTSTQTQSCCNCNSWSMGLLIIATIILLLSVAYGLGVWIVLKSLYHYEAQVFDIIGSIGMMTLSVYLIVMQISENNKQGVETYVSNYAEELVYIVYFLMNLFVVVYFLWITWNARKILSVRSLLLVVE